MNAAGTVYDKRNRPLQCLKKRFENFYLHKLLETTRANDTAQHRPGISRSYYSYSDLQASHHDFISFFSSHMVQLTIDLISDFC